MGTEITFILIIGAILWAVEKALSKLAEASWPGLLVALLCVGLVGLGLALMVSAYYAG
jgi:hypothetical protein